MKLLPAFTSTPETNRIYHCRAEHLLAALPDNYVDLIVTSPPYDNLRTYKGFTWDFEAIALESFRVLIPGGVLVWVVGNSIIDGSESMTSFSQAFYFVDVCGFNLHQRIIWQKKGLPQKRAKAYYSDFEEMFCFSKGIPKTFNPIMRKTNYAGQTNRKGHSGKNGFDYVEGVRITQEYAIEYNVWEISVGNKGDDTEAFEHPAIFPEELARRHIHTWSNTGDIVLDYFSGSGTTAKIARNMGRQFIGCDLSAEYVELAQRRLQNTDPFQATVFKTGEKQLSLFSA